MNNDILQSLIRLTGHIDADELSLLYPPSDERAELLVAVRPDAYSASAIARAVEDCDLQLVNLNLTSARTPDGRLVAAVRVAGEDADAVTRSLGRYGYEVIAAAGSRPSVDDEESRRRAAELLHLLEL